MKKKPLLRHRFALSFVIYTGVLLVLWSGYHIITHQAISGSERENAILAADNLTQRISAEFRNMNTIASVIAGSDYVQDFLSEQNTIVYYEKAAIVSEIVRKTAFPISSADSVITISDSGSYYRFSGGLSNQSLETLYETFKGAGAVYTVIELDGILFFCHSVPVIDYSGRLPVRLGNVLMLTGLDKTRRMLDYGDGVDMTVLLDGIVILSNNPSLEGMAAAHLEPMYGLISGAPLDGTSLSVIAAIPRDALFPERTLFYIIAFTSLCLLLLMIIIQYRYQSGHMIRPMANIMANVREIGGGKVSRLSETGIADFDALVSDINMMLDRMEEYNAALADERQKLYDAKIARQNMRISLLGAQMDAHLVVNTLINIERLAERGEIAKACRMADGLAAILKHQHTGDALVNVFDDFQILEKYIDIMNIKFDGKFTVQYDVDDALEACLMPGLILQPIVENALTHGFGNKEKGSRLTIKGFMRDACIIFEISDNGDGIPPEKLEGIQESLSKAEPGDFPKPGLRGVALTNIQRRIRIKHGDGYGITVESDFGKGTTVTVTLPIVSDG